MDRTIFAWESMTVQYLIEELQKLPPNALLQEVIVVGGSSGWQTTIANVRWAGNRVLLEIGERYA